MKSLNTPLLAACLVSVGCIASASTVEAALIVNASVGGAPAGASYVNFDNLALGNAGGTSGGIGVSFSGTGQTVIGAAGGLYAAPYLSNSNGLPFGDPTNGPDATRYLSTGIGSVTLDFVSKMGYFGLLWGSVDNYNSLGFFDGGTLVGSITGTDVWAGANGNQGVAGTYYVNIYSNIAFDRVIASSSNYAFEFDNVSYNTVSGNTASQVPEPGTLSLFGLAAIAFAAARGRLAMRRTAMVTSST